MKVFVADDALDRVVIGVSGDLGVGEQQPAVEDVESLVFHCAHVEIVGAENHERVEVVLAAETSLVPAHRPLEGLHRMPAARQVLRRRIDVQCNAAPGACRESVFERCEIAGDDGKQIGWLRKRVTPRGEMAIARQRSARHKVAI